MAQNSVKFVFFNDIPTGSWACFGHFWSFLRLQMRSNFPCFPASGAAKRRRWIDNTPEAAYATGEPLAASRRKRAAELARLRANHPEGGIGCQLIIHRSIHISVYMGATSGGGEAQPFFDFALETPATGSLCQESR